MNHLPRQSTNRLLKIFKYFLASVYFVFIGFCAVGAWLKWEDVEYQRKLENFGTHIYEEGFEEVTATLPISPMQKNETFLEKLARRTTPMPSAAKKPVRNNDADEPWQKFAAQTVEVPDNNVKVILVIDDLGIVKGTTKAMIDMDTPLTLSFLPYADDVAEQVNDAYAKGHDILVHIPMEPKGNADPGPHALLSSENAKEQLEDIDYNLNQFSNYIGINNHMGSRFSEDAEAVDRFLNIIKDAGLLVLDSKTTSKSLIEDIAVVKGIPVANRDVFLDNVRDEDYIMGQLAELEKVAKQNGTAIAIGHPYKETVLALKKWIPTLDEKGITVVPISQTVKENHAKRLLASK